MRRSRLGAGMRVRFERAEAALAFLVRHSLEPTPQFYELALGIVDAPDGPLAREVQAIVDGGLRLTAQDATVLAARYTSMASAPVVEAAQAQVLHQAKRLESITAEAQEITSEAHRDIADMPTAETPFAQLAEQMIARLGRAERDMAAMASEIVELRAQIAARGAPPRRNADHDDLTELPSRTAGDALLPALAAEPHGFAIALCKLDQLIAINEQHGRMVGDNVLRAVAATLRQTCKDYEVVRWTGDEFLVIFRATPVARAFAMIQDAREHVAARTLRLRGTGQPIGTVTFSAGIAAGRNVDAAAVVDLARDRALAAMAAGGNRILD